MNKMEITGIIKASGSGAMFLMFPGVSADGVCVHHQKPEFIGHSITTSEIKTEQVLNEKTKLVRTASGSVYLIFCD